VAERARGAGGYDGDVADEERRAKVLLVEDDAAIAELVRSVLADEGFAVSVLPGVRSDALRAAINRLEPDCILLDGESSMAGYGTSWTDAAWARRRGRPIPVVMFTAFGEAGREAEEGESQRSRAAHFAAVLHKPFDLDELVATVRRCVGLVAPFDASPAAETARSRALEEKLRAAGAADVRAAARRESALFRAPDGGLVQLSWSEREGAYRVLRYDEASAAARFVGVFHDLDAAIALAMPGTGRGG
jgi:CheY-like chemotaxis protein